ncbi:unnamed protein product [Didymodactylos carnosus]|uniref:Uncharacterized protein n=1 Tax=Didymodactylos carnosus TaxID=1234261 RepID=A0A814JBT1_9BILA|nr:unnamed protein product [Didymodactylos carnosus]CAF1035941.1 unnamed protein product [Didymodactylos carnosus]CAF3529962.1 unnamed protein product [Didymodactylos carnosus]CAF3806521.1 unnamed protein product [Didymodactylos carnosus]
MALNHSFVALPTFSPLFASSLSSLTSASTFFDISLPYYQTETDIVDENQRSKSTIRRRTRYIAIVIVLIILILLRAHITCLMAMVNCYITWPFSRPCHLRVDVRSLPSEKTIYKYVSRNMHHILLGSLSEDPPKPWLVARNSCVTMHFHFEHYYYWNDTSGRELLVENYPSFVNTYFVLHKFGGVFLGMDLYCLHPFDGIIQHIESKISTTAHILLASKAFPIGVSNGFIIATKHHPLLDRMIRDIKYFDGCFIIPFLTVMFSTGPMYISSQMQLARSTWDSIVVLDDKENMYTN